MTAWPSDRPRPLVLCAEDEHDLRKDICDELREAGYAIIEAIDGEETLQQIEALAPDLILCDIHMPARSGYQVLAEIRERRPDLAQTPFVFLTALSDSREVIEGKRLGADDYLVKPIDFDLLLATVEARLRQVRRMGEQRHQALDELRQAMGELQRQASRRAFVAATRALDLVAPGMVLLDRQGEVLFANREARRLACEANGLRLDTALVALGRSDTLALREAIATTLRASLDGEERVSCLRILRPGPRRDLLMLACSMGMSPSSTIDEPAAVILMADPQRGARIPQRVLVNLFGLTPTEARIALALAEGWRSEEIAEQMSIAPTTVAFHLRNLFQKTDTHRQAELIALVLAGAMSLSLDQEAP